MNSPNALDVIYSIRQNIGTSLVLGAGTVLRRDEVKMAFDSGAQFIVSPNMSPSVVHATKDLGLASFPGCSTCTEILESFRHGADGVKLFPAAAIPPESLRAVRASLGDLRLIPTGGITEENAGQYFAAGAWALGIGSALVNAHQLDSMGETELRRRATAFVAAAAVTQQVQK